MKLIRIIKLRESDNPLYPGNVPEGLIREGACFPDIPEVGKPFCVGAFITSTVQEIIDDNTFRTFNSIYRWEIISDLVIKHYEINDKGKLTTGDS